MAIMKRLILPLALLAALAGCVPSLNPLYIEKDLVFDPALLGVWGEPNAKETWTFEKAGEKKYKLLQTDNDGRTGEFEVHLLKLSNHYFLDLYVTEPGGEKWSPNDLARGAIIMRPRPPLFEGDSNTAHAQNGNVRPRLASEAVGKRSARCPA